jgi:hypothetical protein
MASAIKTKKIREEGKDWILASAKNLADNGGAMCSLGRGC